MEKRRSVAQRAAQAITLIDSLPANFARRLQSAAARSKVEGWPCCNLHPSKSGETLFMFCEPWASQEAIDAHGKTPHMKARGGKLKDKTDKGGGVVFYGLLK